VNASRDVILQVDDVAKATEFYAEVLGLKVTMKSDALIGFEAGAFQLFVEKGPRPGPVFDFLVDDVQAAKRALLEKGCRLVEENPKIPRCYLSDPFGLVFNLGAKR
jgi:catechol 2,3-dioxygenase-like lactoylglutathione lyase family enzyme